MGVNEDLMMKEDSYASTVMEEEDDVPLPGFRFHPTDEELVSFYLKRKLDKKPISIELIKQIDIYKYDPWDLPKASGSGGEKEGYFFCKRGRKYRNSIRPNRVTGSGFWKATGIDKPVYSHGGEGNDCIGLKKTLVYYRGSAGKGTKTDWMMHEFRLPSANTENNTTNLLLNTKNNNHINNADFAQEAEIWTLCRIFKRNVSQRKHTSDLRSHLVATNNKHKTTKTLLVQSNNNNHHHQHHQESYINFGATIIGHHHYQNEQKPLINYTALCNNNNNNNQTQRNNNNNNNNHHHHQLNYHHPSSVVATNTVAHQQQQQMMAPTSNMWINPSALNDFFGFDDDNWDELGSVVKFAVDSPSL